MKTKMIKGVQMYHHSNYDLSDYNKGDKFENWTVLESKPTSEWAREKRLFKFKARCKCGHLAEVTVNVLRKAHQKKNPCCMMCRPQNMQGVKKGNPVTQHTDTMGRRMLSDEKIKVISMRW